MHVVDLSHYIEHKGIAHPRHTKPMIWVWSTHEESRKDLGTDLDGHSSTVKVVQMTDHTGTHVDAPMHFDWRPEALSVDELPLDVCMGPAVCLDLRATEPKGMISPEDMEKASKASGVPIRPGMIVLVCTGHCKRFFGTPEYFTHFPGLSREAVGWLGDKGVKNFGVEAINPGHPDDKGFLAHVECRLRGMIHMENLCNLEEVVGKGEFVFMGLPLKIKKGTGSPMRAVAFLNDAMVKAWSV